MENPIILISSSFFFVLFFCFAFSSRYGSAKVPVGVMFPTNSRVIIFIRFIYFTIRYLRGYSYRYLLRYVSNKQRGRIILTLDVIIDFCVAIYR